ncbi:hypothetical protein K9L67_01075 [Candidatus Woesearchaeota archaeon]|nr:hypothetical protein [Candidatus Woesearchaeota archaeon]MCF7900796.1 hypothetical protein [Candidatus Woesearchaeota archaeon]MCF8013098.1 hypothetical protein [Candidatus Woesearchaeota archaeon]
MKQKSLLIFRIIWDFIIFTGLVFISAAMYDYLFKFIQSEEYDLISFIILSGIFLLFIGCFYFIGKYMKKFFAKDTLDVNKEKFEKISYYVIPFLSLIFVYFAESFSMLGFIVGYIFRFLLDFLDKKFNLIKKIN